MGLSIYADFKRVLMACKPIERMTTYLNLETELRARKATNRKVRRFTRDLRQHYMSQDSIGVATGAEEMWKAGIDALPIYTPYKTDLMPIRLCDVYFSYDIGGKCVEEIIAS